MRQHRIRTYGPGGFDASKPNNNLISDVTLEVEAGPLDQAGALATLLAVLELSTVEDAANAVGLTEQDLVDEAEAWQAMKGTP